MGGQVGGEVGGWPVLPACATHLWHTFVLLQRCQTSGGVIPVGLSVGAGVLLGRAQHAGNESTRQQAGGVRCVHSLLPPYVSSPCHRCPRATSTRRRACRQPTSQSFRWVGAEEEAAETVVASRRQLEGAAWRGACVAAAPELLLRARQLWGLLLLLPHALTAPPCSPPTCLQPDTLFYIFYGMPGDEAQLFAADELAARWVQGPQPRGQDSSKGTAEQGGGGMLAGQALEPPRARHATRAPPPHERA